MRPTKAPQPDAQKIGWFIFECLMAVLYLVFGGIFLFSPMFDKVVHGGLRIALGIVLGLYGIFRVFRAVRKIIQKNNK